MKDRRGRPQTLTTPQKFEIRLMREAGVMARECAAYFDTSEATVYRVMSELRAKLGPEKLKRAQSARWHLTARNLPDKQNERTSNNAS